MLEAVSASPSLVLPLPFSSLSLPCKRAAYLDLEQWQQYPG
jgi:hypothetical protein